MTQPEVDERVQRWADEAWPLRFSRHGFGARCWNVQRCSIIYDNREHGTVDPYIYSPVVYRSAGAPPNVDWKELWSANHSVAPAYHGGKIFPAEPVKINWISLDSTEHSTAVDLDAIFKDRLVLHNVEREDIPVSWLAAWENESIDILLEVNDRTINVYSRALDVSCDLTEPENLDKRQLHSDLILAWTHTY